jgi:hypothetical protein
VSRLTRALAAASMAIAAAGSGLFIAAAGAPPARAAAPPAPPGGHTITITAYPTARAGGTGPRVALSCPPHEDCLPPITCWISVDTPSVRGQDPAFVVASAETRCTQPVGLKAEEDLIYTSGDVNRYGPSYFESDTVLAGVGLPCRAGGYINHAGTEITWPPGYDTPLAGSNPIQDLVGPVVFTADDCNGIFPPNVVGDSAATAGQTITGAGLVVGRLTTNHQCLSDAGYVVGQDPGESTRVRPGTAVNLDISTGTDTHNRACIRP